MDRQHEIDEQIAWLSHPRMIRPGPPEMQRHDGLMIDSIRAALKRLPKLELDASWGAHNGGAHQLIKLHHTDAMKLYAALKRVRPNHPLVDAMRQSYCEIWRAGSAAGKQPPPEGRGG